ncbi:MAG: hypothetical protein K2Q18_19360, partial [Bdellovibrionales bacterium]|nr:hypothetical protein [Bdellovibrionales bacterium]
PRFKKQKCKIYISGNFSEDLKATKLDPVYIRNIKPVADMSPVSKGKHGLGVGILARATNEMAKEDADSYFSYNREKSLMASLAFSNSATPWVNWLNDYKNMHPVDHPNFDLRGVLQFTTAAPYLVGSYEQVKAWLQSYIDLGYSSFVFDYPENDTEHIMKVLKGLNAK